VAKDVGPQFKPQYSTTHTHTHKITLSEINQVQRYHLISFTCRI
jgi:hypothetical protein